MKDPSIEAAGVERALVAYAVLGDRISSADMYEGLWEFIRPIVYEMGGKRFVPEEAVGWLRQRYALDMPVVVMSSLATRLVQAGILEESAVSKGVSAFTYALPSEPREAADEELYQRSQHVLRAFREFVASQKQSLPTPQPSVADLDSGFFQRLLNVESLALLSKRDNLVARRKTERTLALRGDADVPAETPRQALDFLFSEFLLTLADSDPGTFEFLTQVAGANLVAEALLTYREPPGRNEMLSGMDLYIDGPLCLDMLGANVGREELGRELRQLIAASGARPLVFHHTVVEMEQVLDAKKNSYLLGTERAVRPNERTVDPSAIRQRVIALSGHVESFLVDTLKFTVTEGSATMLAAVRNRIGATEERAVRDRLVNPNPEAIEVDVQTACELMRLQQGRAVRMRIQDPGATLLSRNNDLIATTNDVWRTHVRDVNRATSDRANKAAPIAMSEKKFCGIAWIAGGGRLGEVTRARLVSNCLAATRLRKDVVTKVLNVLKTSPEDQEMFRSIMLDQRAERALMKATRGDTSVITDESVIPLLREVRDAAAKEVVMRKDEEIRALRREHDDAQSATRVAIEEMDQELLTLRSDAKNRAMEDRNWVNGAFVHARRAYKMATGAIVLLIAVLTFCLTEFLRPLILGSVPEPWNERLSFIVAAFALVGSLVLTAWDMPELIFGRARSKFTKMVFWKVVALRVPAASVQIQRADYLRNELEFAIIADPGSDMRLRRNPAID